MVAEKKSAVIKVVPLTNEGIIDTKALKKLISSKTKIMGFSGATIAELLVSSGTSEHLLILKINPRQVPRLPSDATEAARLRAERTDASFQNELAFLAEPGLVEALLSKGCRPVVKAFVWTVCRTKRSQMHWQMKRLTAS